MKQNEQKRLTKAHQSTQLLLSDVREVQSKTDNVALEELMLTAIEQLARISRLLGRLASDSSDG